MPDKPKNWQDYFNRLSKTLNNFEQRLEKIEDKVDVLSSKSAVPQKGVQTEIVYQSPPRRRIGVALIWLAILILISPMFRWFGFYVLSDIFSFIPFGSSLFFLGAL